MPSETTSAPHQPQPNDVRYYNRDKILVELNQRGFPITQSYWAKLNLPSVNGGPPVARWFGKRPLYRLEDALAWAESRCSNSRGKLVA